MTDIVVENWYQSDRDYYGTGTPLFYSDMASLIAYQIRQVQFFYKEMQQQ